MNISRTNNLNIYILIIILFNIITYINGSLSLSVGFGGAGAGTSPSLPSGVDNTWSTSLSSLSSPLLGDVAGTNSISFACSGSFVSLLVASSTSGVAN